jgi:hypothetical protein
MQHRTSRAALFTFVTLTLLLHGGAVDAADTPVEPAIVIKLPSTMTPAEVRQLVGDLEAKGATLAASPITASPATTGSLVWRVVNRMREAAPQARRFIELRSLWVQAMAWEGQPTDENFWPLLAGLVAAALLIEFLIRAGLSAVVPGLEVKPGMPLFRAFARHTLRVGLGVVGFLIVIRCGIGFLGEGSPLLTGIGSRVADGAAEWRIAMAILTALAAPGLAAARPLLLDDDGARAVTGWINVYLISGQCQPKLRGPARAVTVAG